MKKTSLFLVLFLAVILAHGNVSKVTDNPQRNSSAMVAWFPFNGNANDATANNHDGVVNGAEFTSDRFGNANSAFSFNGSSDFIEISNIATLKLPEYTYIAWVYPTALPAGTSSSTSSGIILDIGGMLADQFLSLLNYSPWYGFGCSGYYSGGGTYNLQTGTLPVLNQWYQLAVTRSSNNYSFFIDGVLINSIPLSGAGPDYDNPTFGYIGKRMGDMQFFEGKLDDIRIYNHALTDVELFQQYKNDSSGLVAYFPFNGNANDESGNGYHGTVAGATLTTDRFNQTDKSYNFVYNGFSSDKIQVTGTSDLNFSSGGFSIGAWVNFSGTATTGYNYPIFSKHICGEQSGFILMLYNGKLTFWLAGSGGYNVVSTSGDYTDNAWHHVVAVYDGSTQYVYVDGVLKNSIPFSYTTFNSANWALGGYNGCNGGFNGKVDEIQVFNHALTGAEIQIMYDSTQNPLVAYYPFNENANDASGNGNNGINHNGIYSKDRFGKENASMLFTGNNSYVEGINPGIALPTGNSPRTITAWIKENSFHPWGNNIFHYGLDQAAPTNFHLYNTDVIRFGNGYDYGIVAGTTPVADSRWHFVAGVYEGGTEHIAKVYVDGKLDNTGNLSSEPNTILGTNWKIGRFMTGSSNFDGEIDEIKVFNKALTGSEISQEYDLTRNSLVAYFPFNSNANDESGNGYDGNINGNTKLTSDRFMNDNKAFTFPDQSSNISLANSTNLNLENGFTINAWVKYKNSYAVIVSKHTCGFVNGFVVGIDYDGQIQLWLASSGWSTVRTNTSFTENKWYMITASYDSGTGIAKIYIDGEISGSANVTYNNFSSYPIAIGEAYQNNCQPANMSGVVDEVKIYDRPLNEEEIRKEYRLARAGLIAYYPFNGNANDESGNGNHGTITGALVTPAADRFGEEGKAYKFWFPDYISVTTNSSFFTDEFTVSYWYKVEAYWGSRCVLSCVGNKGGYQQPFEGSGFYYLFGYNFPNNSWFWTSYNITNTPNTWQHITTSYKKTGDNASISKLYIDGELKSSDSYANFIAYPGSEVFYIGRNHSDVGLNGELDEVRFYNRMLTDEEVLALHAEELHTAVNNQSVSDIRISPNPTDRHFVVEMDKNYAKIQLRIMDMTGREIKRLRYSNMQRMNLDIDGPSGIYFLNIVTEGQNKTYKLIMK